MPLRTVKSLSALKASKKLRLYVAYHKRNYKGDPLSFHTTILLAQKNPAGEEANNWLFHVWLSPKDKRRIWTYEALHVQARTSRLHTLLFLGKVNPKYDAEAIRRLLEAIPVVQDRNWECQYWICDAILYLAREGIIPNVCFAASDLWKTGLDFAYSHPVNPLTAVPTCDYTGKQILSELLNPLPPRKKIERRTQIAGRVRRGSEYPLIRQSAFKLWLDDNGQEIRSMWWD